MTGWRILWFSGEFKTRLIVDEDKRKSTVTFKLKDSDVMRAFHGSWRLKAYKEGAQHDLHGSSLPVSSHSEGPHFDPFSAFVGPSPCTGTSFFLDMRPVSVPSLIEAVCLPRMAQDLH